jgi:hypothetical protein
MRSILFSPGGRLVKKIALFSALVGLSFSITTGVLYGQQQTPTISAPSVLRITGALETALGVPRTGTVVLVASLYSTGYDLALERGPHGHTGR